MKHSTIIGVDLAKDIFQVAIMQEHKITLNKSFTRKKLMAYFVNLKPTTVAMEACYSSHYWGRLFESYGHKVLLIPA